MAKTKGLHTKRERILLSVRHFHSRPTSSNGKNILFEEVACCISSIGADVFSLTGCNQAIPVLKCENTSPHYATIVWNEFYLSISLFRKNIFVMVFHGTRNEMDPEIQSYGESLDLKRNINRAGIWTYLSLDHPK